MVKKVCVHIVYYKNPEHGISIYAQSLKKLFKYSNKLINFENSFFSDDGVTFSPIDKITNSCQSRIFHINYDTNSQFWRYQENIGLLIFRHLQLIWFIFLLKSPVIMTIHGLFDSKSIPIKASNILENVFIFLLLKTVNISFVLHSNNLKQRLLKSFPGSSSKFTYLPHPIYKNIIKGEKEILFGKNPDKRKTLITLGFIGKWKGQYEILKIIRKLSKVNSKFKYYIFGKSVDDDYYIKCKEYVLKYNLNKLVSIKNRFLSQEEYSLYLRSSDIYLDFHINKKHASSGTLAHAAISGKVVVTSNTFFGKELDSKNVYVASSSDNYFHILNSLVKSKLSPANVNWDVVGKTNNTVKQGYLNLYIKASGLNR